MKLLLLRSRGVFDMLLMRGPAAHSCCGRRSGKLYVLPLPAMSAIAQGASRATIARLLSLIATRFPALNVLLSPSC